MGDSTLWVAALTAATAVLASWVTSRGTARAAYVDLDAMTCTGRVRRRCRAGTL